jgi:hypothetical protein
MIEILNELYTFIIVDAFRSPTLMTFMLGILGIQIVIYQNTASEGKTRVLLFAIESYFAALMDLFNYSRWRFFTLFCFLPFIGRAVFFLSIIAVIVLEITHTTKKKPYISE